ncbi:cytochrome P450 [Afifella sp. IM 167]|uniref:cytochrome P450 n=1 Tax=Afifella sp. IM 167 TaxID=2033586 RepID=UPI001CCF6A21|nr:cytochrome P450 [Afifella sp. IM 167]MBZ8132154.1 cytochrome [Afifella sp. IM 167]
MAMTDVAMRQEVQLRASDVSAGPGEDLPPFDRADLEWDNDSLLQRIDIQLVFGLLRRFRPILRLRRRNLVLVTRYDDVQEVLGRDEDFPVLFGQKVADLNDGPNFLLGMARSPEYWKIQEQVMRAFRHEDVAAIVAPLSAEIAADVVARAPGRLDAVQDLIAEVPVRVVERYYGLDIAPQERRPLAEWSIAMSTYLFADIDDDPKRRRVARAGARRLRDLIDRSIAAAKAGSPKGPVMQRLLAMQQSEGLSDEMIRAFFVGMISGFVPTNTMAAGNMLETLLSRPAFMAAAHAAARDGDDERLWRVLRETSRFKPINPGPFRGCAKDTVIAAGTPRETKIAAGTRLLVSTQSAMFDRERVRDPASFDPDRAPHEYMIFGYGMHWCVGALIARAQITQTMRQLLARDGLRRAPGDAGQLKHLGPFPWHLVVEFDR